MRNAWIIWALLLAVPSQARTLVVDGSGGSEYSTVRSALWASVGGDTILIHPGTYDEYDGPDATNTVGQSPLTIIGTGSDAEETALRLSIDFLDSDCTIVNLLFHREDTPLVSSGTMVIRGCRFDQNGNDGLGGGAIRMIGGSLVVEDTAFTNNSALGNDSPMGGAVFVDGGAPVTLRRCVCKGNQAESGGALYVWTADAEDSVFMENEADHGAAIMAASLNTMTRCTLLRNRIRVGPGAALESRVSDWLGVVSHSIIARTSNGWGVECGGFKTLECCDVWGNEAGDYAGMWCSNLESDGNFSADPVFCDWAAGDVGLQEGSPCVPGLHGGVQCGIIGARGLECPGTAVEAVSWGKVRGMFR
ncbi:MAG: hypothetical protein ACE15D_16365 [Candidatus Eisenbacteria bacterium]